MKRFHHKAHKALWDFLANNPQYEKVDFFYFIYNDLYLAWKNKTGFKGKYNWCRDFVLDGFFPKHLCYACGVGYMQTCNCPLDWGNGKDLYRVPCERKGSPYEKWNNCYSGWIERDSAEACDRVMYARQVRDLPFNVNFKEEK